LKYLYLSNGFLNVRVHHAYRPILPDSNATVYLQIEEGPRYLFGASTLEGSYDRQFHTRLRELVAQLRRGAPADLFLLKDTESAIKSFLSNRVILMPESAILSIQQADRTAAMCFSPSIPILCPFR